MKRRKVTACAMAALMAMGLVGTVMPVYAKSNLKNVDDVVEIKMAVWTSGAADIYNKAAEGFMTMQKKQLLMMAKCGDFHRCMNGGVYFIIKIFLKKQELKKCRKLLMR